LWDTQCRPDKSVAAAIQIGLEQQALDLATLGLLLRFDLMEGSCRVRLDANQASIQANSRAAGLVDAATGDPCDSMIGTGRGECGKNDVATLVVDIFLRYLLP
jgi:hypothetical protein